MAKLAAKAGLQTMALRRRRRTASAVATRDLFICQAVMEAIVKAEYRPGKIASANNPIKAPLKNNWVIYAKKPFGSPRTVLDYLGRYTHRVALSNDRILSVENGQVTFTYRDRKDKDRLKSMPLDAQEFIRRFLLICG